MLGPLGQIQQLLELRFQHFIEELRRPRTRYARSYCWNSVFSTSLRNDHEHHRRFDRPHCWNSVSSTSLRRLMQGLAGYDESLLLELRFQHFIEDGARGATSGYATNDCWNSVSSTSLRRQSHPELARALRRLLELRFQHFIEDARSCGTSTCATILLELRFQHFIEEATKIRPISGTDNCWNFVSSTSLRMPMIDFYAHEIEELLELRFQHFIEDHLNWAVSTCQGGIAGTSFPALH